MDSMIRSAMAIEREVNDARSIRDAGLVIRGERVNFFLLARERRRELLLLEGFRDRVATTRAKARISHPKMGDTSGLLASQGRERVSNATNLDT